MRTSIVSTSIGRSQFARTPCRDRVWQEWWAGLNAWTAAQGEIATREPQREFALDHEITTIGSADNAVLRLEGIEAQHSEVRHDANDEYVWVRVGDITTATVHGRPAAHAVLRTGARIELAVRERGLLLVDAVTADWGVTRVPGGKTVSARLHLPAPVLTLVNCDR